MNKHPLAFVCSPYRANTIAGIAQNIAVARRIAEAGWLAGFTVFCPHLNSFMMDGLVADERFLKGAHQILEKCNILLIGPNWINSEGCKAEVALADKLGIEKCFVSLTSNKVLLNADNFSDLFEL